jgi:hypothetical protein
MSRLLILAPLALFFAGPAVADTFVRDDIVTEPDRSNFSVCHDHGCAEVDQLSLSPHEWRSLQRLFSRTSASPAQERDFIARAIAHFETLVGEHTGTWNDKAADLKGLGQRGQMDCIDESTNTTTYLRILQREKLLRWHTVEDRATRGWFITGWPHTTAVIRDKQSGETYAVDSWFRDNGQPPYILPLKQWKEGWDPGDDH